MWKVTAFLVGVFLMKAVAGEQCRALGGLTTFSCPRLLIDDSDDIYCCDGDCCDNCWESDDTSACTSRWGDVGKALQLGIGAIIGIAIAAIVGVILIIVACVCCCCYLGKQQTNLRGQGQQMVPVAQPAGHYPPPGGQYPPPAGQYPPPAYPPTAGPYPPLSDPAYPQDGGYVPTKI